MALHEAVTDAVKWAIDGDGGRAKVLANLAVELARETKADHTVADKPPPVAPLAKELRATMEDLEGLRDSDDASASLSLVLSTPIWYAAQPEAADTRPARRKGQRQSG